LTQWKRKDEKMKTPQEIVTEAIKEWQPVRVICLFSGGYDSMAMTHLAKSLDMHGVPLAVWAVDTKLSADGWTDYMHKVASELDLQDFHIYDNQKGFQEYKRWVKEHGNPRTRKGHTRAYRRLKETAFNAIHMMYKRSRHDKTLFLSGMRKHESAEREKSMIFEVHRAGNSNKIFANPLFWWTDLDIARYRIEHDLPDNPFYDTVKGSGDCQCNWGNFITIGTLRLYSPELAVGNVAVLDKISKDNHGYGWDGEPANISPMFDTEEYWGKCNLTTPFLCGGCSRKGAHKHKAAEEVMLQRGLF
jgi:3'-phosphoadenosine 5'-phosphosulfate sulfotransferase (PAPS reductase)/FAD synthetase